MGGLITRGKKFSTGRQNVMKCTQTTGNFQGVWHLGRQRPLY